MNVIERIKNFFTRKNSGLELNSTNLFKQADLTAEALSMMLEALRNPYFNADFGKAVNQLDRPGGRRYFLTGAAYDKFLLRVPPKWLRNERDHPLISLIAVTGTVIEDLTAIMSDFGEYFQDEQVNDNDIRMSTLIVSGYIQTAYMFAKWLSALFLVRDHYKSNGQKVKDDSVHSAAKYLIDDIDRSLPYAMQLGGEVLNRKPNTSLLLALKELRVDSRDVSLNTQGMDITAYADDSHFSKVELDYATMGMINPLQWLGKHFVAQNSLNYKRNKELRAFIQTRIALLESQRNTLDTTSAEYKKIENTLSNYMDQIASIDKEIERYEVYR